MGGQEFPSSWRDPRYIAALTGVIALGVVFAYLATADVGVAPEKFALLLVAVLGPVVVAYELVKRTIS